MTTPSQPGRPAVPTPGSPAALAIGCNCPRYDNAHGAGYMGGAKDESGATVFVMREDCPLHGTPVAPTLDAIELHREHLSHCPACQSGASCMTGEALKRNAERLAAVRERLGYPGEAPPLMMVPENCGAVR